MQQSFLKIFVFYMFFFTFYLFSFFLISTWGYDYHLYFYIKFVKCVGYAILYQIQHKIDKRFVLAEMFSVPQGNTSRNDLFNRCE